MQINPEFRDKIPPLTEDEYRQLEENIVADGEIYEPIITWRGTIIDGHNRWRIHLAHPEIPYRTKEVDFADKWAAFDWMYRKQLGRRNLTDEQRTYLLGKLYESRKMVRGGDRRSAKFSKHENHAFEKERPIKTSHQIAKEVGVGSDTVEKAAVFAKGLDSLREISPAAADAILQGKADVTKATVREISKMDEADKHKVADAIEQGKPVRVPTVKPVKAEKQKPERSGDVNSKEVYAYPAEQTTAEQDQPTQKKSAVSYAIINKVYSDMVSGSLIREYTADDLIAEIENNAEAYLRQLKQTLTVRSTVLSTADIRVRVRNALQDIQEKIKKLEVLL